ncbi:hypothetical protein GCM10017554_12260 [Acinetobacter modestus]|nr:hypothetical protein GCM10017554_12260 [Acinetobacter modestus]
MVVLAGATFVDVEEAVLFVLRLVERGRVVLVVVLAALGVASALLLGVEVAFDVFDTVS